MDNWVIQILFMLVCQLFATHKHGVNNNMAIREMVGKLGCPEIITNLMG